ASAVAARCRGAGVAVREGGTMDLWEVLWGMRVRWEMVPDAARRAVEALSRQQRRVLAARCRGESFAEIAEREKVTRQAVESRERVAIRRLCQLAGRSDVPATIRDVLRSGKAEYRRQPGDSEAPHSGGAIGSRAQAQWDALVDSFIASGGADRE